MLMLALAHGHIAFQARLAVPCSNMCCTFGILGLEHEPHGDIPFRPIFDTLTGPASLQIHTIHQKPEKE